MIGMIAKPLPMTVTQDSGNFRAQFPAANVSNNDYARLAVADIAANSEAFIAVDVGYVANVTVLAALWNNMSDGTGKVVYTAHSATPVSAANQIWTSAQLPPSTGTTTREVLPYSKQLLTLAAAVSARYWAVHLVNTSGAAKTYVLSRFVVGFSSVFAVGPQKANLGAKDLNANVTTEIGETRFQEDPTLIRPVVSLSLQYARQSEMEQVLGQYTLSLGVSRPMLVCTDLTTAYLQDCLAFGRAEQVMSYESTIYNVWAFDAVVTSIGP